MDTGSCEAPACERDDEDVAGVCAQATMGSAVASASEDWDVRAAFGLGTLELPRFSSEALATDEVASCRSKLEANPRDFDSWLQLSRSVETLGTAAEAKATYFALLAEFPLCWGFWRRVAELEAAQHGPLAAAAACERGLEAGAAACLDLWLGYCEALCSACRQGECSEAVVRAGFERALGAAGHDWHGGCLWQAYLDFEEDSEDWRRLGAVFRRALLVPNAALAAVHARVRSLIVGDTCPPLEDFWDAEAEVVAHSLAGLPGLHQADSEARAGQVPPGVPNHTTDRVADGKADAPQQLSSGQRSRAGELSVSIGSCGSALPAASATQTEGGPPRAESKEALGDRTCSSADDLEEGELLVAAGSVASDADRADEPPYVMSASRLSWEMSAAQQQALHQHELLVKSAEVKAEKLRGFEEHLHRTYFHEKPLGLAQRDAWHRYLDFEEARTPRDEARLHALYRRCLVAANNHVEFWLRYAALLEGSEPSGEGLQQACLLFEVACLSGRLRGRAAAITAWAEFEEQCGRAGRARRLLDGLLEGPAQGCADVILRRAALERRAGCTGSCAEVLRRALFDDPSKLSLPTRSVVTSRYSQICIKVLRRPDLAEAAFEHAWRAGCRDASFVSDFAAMLLSVAMPERRSEALLRSSALFEEALKSCGSQDGMEAACTLWSCYIDMLVARGASLAQLRTAQARARLSCQTGFGVAPMVGPERQPSGQTTAPVGALAAECSTTTPGVTDDAVEKVFGAEAHGGLKRLAPAPAGPESRPEKVLRQHGEDLPMTAGGE